MITARGKPDMRFFRSWKNHENLEMLSKIMELLPMGKSRNTDLPGINIAAKRNVSL